ncbi:MAG TPA: lactate utilization protein B/C, partial [Cryomorphaceae bacterium]|nr:lactate utilization protein B/C [Cryomorphaceae bacterium]
MEESKKKKGFFGKVFSVLSGKPEDENHGKPAKKGEFAPRQKEPVDLAFVKNFTESGGKFLYCENESDAYDFLKNITRESGISLIFCKDPNLQSILGNAGLNYTDTGLAQADAFCADCEFLISFNGGIMISENQTRGKKLTELPETFITIARTSQIVENLCSG